MRTPDGLDEFRWRWMLLRRPRTEWFFLLHAATGPAGFQDIRVYCRDGISDARLVWKVCHQCERGVISKISLSRKCSGKVLAHALSTGHFWMVPGIAGRPVASPRMGGRSSG